MSQSAQTPVIFWHSDPVGPDETLVLSGEFFDSDSKVELAMLANAAAGKPRPATLSDLKWKNAQVLQVGDHSLKALIPADWPQGVYACRVTNGSKKSAGVLVNQPDAWWFQGDRGVQCASLGGWLRIQGKCLDHQQRAQAMLVGGDSKPVTLKRTMASTYSIGFDIPKTLGQGAYELWIHSGLGGGDGWTNAGSLNVRPAEVEPEITLNVLDYGIDSQGVKDCTCSLIQMFERLTALGGGVVYFPPGRYRIDSILRPGMFIDTPLRVPRFVTLRGAGTGLTSLWWPDRNEPLPSLIESQGNVTIEDLSIYTQGRHRGIIHGEGENNIIRRVRIRANSKYMCVEGGTHHGRANTEPADKCGPAINLWGRNVHVTDCDIYSTGPCISLSNVQGGRVANNIMRGMHCYGLFSSYEILFEDNRFEGNNPYAGGNTVGIFYGDTISRHVYLARNEIAHIYGGDHESMTLDGHGSVYLGRAASARNDQITLARDVVLGRGGRDSMADTYHTVLYIHSGRGAGQYRFIKKIVGRQVTLEKPLDIQPDQSSILSIGAFNGHHLFIGNTMRDAGTTAQLYPPNCMCIVAENKTIHASNINSLSKLGRSAETKFHRLEPSWYNQFLDNHIVMGNGWGGGETEIDRWIGGACFLNIWGWQVCFEVDKFGCDMDRPLTMDDLATMLGETTAPADGLPFTQFQIVRRHRVDNNSHIRIRAAVKDILVEKCDIRMNPKGIMVDREVHKKHTANVEMTHVEPELPDDDASQPADMLTPQLVLLRKNQFTNVAKPYGGTAIKQATIL